jgi:putative hemolysin
VTLVISYLSLVFCELAPKRLALQRSERWGLAAVRPLTAMATLFRPFIWVLGRSTDAAVRLAGGDPDVAREHMTHDEVRDLVESQPTFTPEQREIIGSAFEVSARTLREVLVPRRDTVALDRDRPAAEGLRTLVAAGHMRAPVTSGSLDDVVGVVHLVGLLGGDGTVGEHANPVVVLPETVEVLDALRRLRAARQHLAVVINEHGGTEGIVTLEDLLEEIVGEIYDEFDPDSAPVHPWPDGSYELTGRFPIHDLGDLGVTLPEGEYTTVAGLVLDRLGRLAEPGDVVHADGWDIEVLAVDRRAIEQVRLVPAPGDGPDGAPEEGAPS